MNTTLAPARLALFPETAAISQTGTLTIAGVDTVGLVREYGSPLYVFDEATLRAMCRAFVDEFSARLPEVSVTYACKAYIGKALAQLLKEEGVGADVVSAGEMGVLQSVDFPMEHVDFHGNNKSVEELRLALRLGVGRIVVDNFHELVTLNDLAMEAGQPAKILLRVTPGVDPHTHAATTTGTTDVKFGFTIANGDAETAVQKAMQSSHLDLVGLHIHLGSPIYELEPYEQGVDVLFEFAQAMRDRHHFVMREMSPGGGFAIQYTLDRPAPAVAAYADVIAGAILRNCEEREMAVPKVIIEPGRSIVGRAGVALYTVGSTKDIPGIRRYVSVDGGMADNIRPAIYGSQYEALLANRAAEPDSDVVTIAGKYCESGDILIRDIALPPVGAGDVVAIPASGAYCLAMASGYNAALKPPVVFVKDGAVRLVRRRETLEDLLRLDQV